MQVRHVVATWEQMCQMTKIKMQIQRHVFIMNKDLDISFVSYKSIWAYNIYKCTQFSKNKNMVAFHN